MKHYMVSIFLAFFCAGSITLIAQTQDHQMNVKVKKKVEGSKDLQVKTSGDAKVIWIDEDAGEVQIDAKDFLVIEQEDDEETEKSISVEMEVEEEDGVTKRDVEITIDEGDNTRKIEWEDNGTIPEDIKQMLEKEEIDIAQFENNEGESTTVVVEEESSKKEGKEKSINVNIEKSEKGGEIKRTGTVIIEEGGEEEIIKWTDQGTLPEDIKKQLVDKGVNVSEIDSEDEAEENAKSSQKKVIKIKGEDLDNLDEDTKKLLEKHDIDIYGLKKTSKGTTKKVKAIFNGEEGEEKIMEWDGEGEIPSEMKEILDKEDIDISDDEVSVKSSHKKKYKIKTIDDDGNTKVLEWDGTGEMPEEMKKLMDEGGNHQVKKKKINK